MSNKETVILSDDDIAILDELKVAYAAAGITRENGPSLAKPGCWSIDAGGEMHSDNVQQNENGTLSYKAKDGFTYSLPQSW